MDCAQPAPRKALGGYQSMTKKSLQNSIRVRPKELEEFIAARLKRRPYRRKETTAATQVGIRWTTPDQRLRDRTHPSICSYPAGQARSCLACRLLERALGGFAGPARVQTEVTGAEGHQLEQSTHKRNVLQKVEQLVLVGDIAMKDEGSCDRKGRQNGAQRPYLPTENKQQAAAELNNNG